MKRSAKKSARAAANTGDCDNSPPYPAKPPATGEIPGAGVVDFVFYGKDDIAKGINDGGLVMHTMRLPDGELAYVFSLRAGPHKRRTLSKISLKALLGPCTVVIQQGATRVLQTGDTMDLPAGSTFSFATSDKAVLLGRSLAGPGLGYGWPADEP